MEIDAQINYGKLKDLVKAMSKECSVKVGLLSGKGGSEEVSKDLDLAGLGALHEFGADIKITKKMAAFLHFKAKDLGLPEQKGKGDGYIHIPARSWLQMPLEKKNELKKKILDSVKSSPEEIAEYILRSGDFESLAIIIGASAVKQIQEAFNTNGFGEWKPNSPLTVAQKGSDKPLVDTSRLKNAVAYEVEKNG